MVISWLNNEVKLFPYCWFLAFSFSFKWLLVNCYINDEESFPFHYMVSVHT